MSSEYIPEVPEAPKFPNIPPNMDDIPARNMTIYLGMELFRIFEVSDKVNIQRFSAVAVGLGVAGNMLLIFLTFVCSSMRSKTFVIESFRAAAEITLLITSVLLVYYNQYNVNDRNDQIVSAFAIFWLSAVASSLLGLLQSVRCFIAFVRTKGGIMTSVARLMGALTSTGALIVITALVSGILYVTSILAFMVIGCFLYFLPFVVSFCLDIIKLFCLKRNATKAITDPVAIYSVDTDNDQGQLIVGTGQHTEQFRDNKRQDRQKNSAEIFGSFLAGCLHTLAFSIVTLVMARIGMVFFSKSHFVILEGLTDIMTLPGLNVET